ncbi:MAG: hypothetical protein AB1424_01630 [Thermodesulfobacteriota bacterium]
MLRKSCLLFFILLFAAGTRVSWSGNIDEDYIIGLRYPKSYDVKTYQDIIPNVRAVKYKVRLSFPSKEVLLFYNKKLKDMGWLPFVQPNYPENDRKWWQFVDFRVEGKPLVHQLIAEWVNKDRTKMVFLAIQYYSIYLNKEWNVYASEKNPNNDIQEVELQIGPFAILEPPEPGKID